MNDTYDINHSNGESTAQEAVEVFSGNEVQGNLTLKQKVEGFISKVADGYNAIMDRFLTVRIICSFTALCSTIGLIIMLISPDSSGWIRFFEVIGVLSALISCPLELLKAIAGLIFGGFTIGLAFFGVGCIAGAAFGLVIGLGLVLYAPAIVTIPYCRNELMK